MNKNILINRLNPQDHTEDKKKIFFIVGGLNLPTMENDIIDVLQKKLKLSLDDIVVKYDGVELNITTQKIPEVIKILAEENIAIYSVYQIYSPSL